MPTCNYYRHKIHFFLLIIQKLRGEVSFAIVHSICCEHSLDMLTVIAIIFSAPLTCHSLSWNFSKFNIFDDVTLWRFTIWRNRAFFAVPRWSNDSIWRPTLLEAPWYPEQPPELQFLLPQPSAFPGSSNIGMQAPDTRCKNLISIVGLDTDYRGRLWILDSLENSHCPAKIVIFDLRQNEEICRDFLTGVPKKRLENIIIDPVMGLWGYRAYIGDPGDDSIIAYSLGHTGQRKWWRVHLLHNQNVPRIISTDLAICRRNHLFITGGNSLDLFSINLESLRNEEPHNSVQITNATYHGIKMGVSSGLLCDAKGGLHYFLVTEHASVRWDTKHDLKASSHTILLQTEEVLSITDYRMDVQKNVWGLVNTGHPFLGRSKGSKVRSELFNRVIKVYKHNKFGN